MSVAVTGGSGVVGSAIVRHLVAAGRDVVATSRRRESDEALTALGAVPVRCDITSTPTLAAAFEGSDVVYHVAGVNTMCPTDPSEMERVNVGGSMAVLRAAEAAGVRRMVYTSSAATIGERTGITGTEETPHRGWYLSHYERSKHLAEMAVFAAARELEVVSVNPSSVQGPGRSTGTARLILDLLHGRLPALVDTSVSIVDIDDCARGHLLAESHGEPGARYLLNSFTLTMREAIGVLEGVLDAPLAVRWIPGWLAASAAVPLEMWDRGRGRPPRVCREMVRTLRHGHSYDGSKATTALGLEYRTAPDVMRRLIDWFRTEGLL